jgi:hypothetical protein
MEAWAPSGGTAQDRELLAQEKVLGGEVGAAAEESVERGREQREELEHGDAMMAQRADSRTDRPSRPDSGHAGEKPRTNRRSSSNAWTLDDVRREYAAPKEDRRAIATTRSYRPSQPEAPKTSREHHSAPTATRINWRAANRAPLCGS